MSKLKRVGIVILLLVGLVLLIDALTPHYSYNADWDGEILPVDYSELNVHSKPNSYTVITILYEGDTVHLTGNRCALTLNDSPRDLWVEILLEDGSTGWIVTAAIT